MGSTPLLGPPPLPIGGEQWALFLDIDGTLVPFADEPALVRVDAATLGVVQRLSDLLGGAVAVLSGRCLGDIDAVLSPLRLPTGGLHGHELRAADGRVEVVMPHADAAANMLARARESVAALPGVTLEEKRGIGVALHFRRAREHAHAVHAAATEIAAATDGGYEVQAGDCVVEIKPVGADKGTALQRLMAQPGFRARRPVMVGDDLTDEAAFAMADRLGGFGVVVGARLPTVARHRLPGPEAVAGWLRALERHVEELEKPA